MQTEAAVLALVPVGPSLPRGDRSERRRGEGPGWFDSSWDLRCGLEVHEGWSEDDRVRGWIADFLCAQRAAGRTASPSASTAIA